MYPYPPNIHEVNLATGAGKVNELCNSLESYILATTHSLSQGSAAWRIYDDLSSGGNYDKVFYSSGSNLQGGAGAAAIFFRLQRNSSTALRLLSYSDWSTVEHAGTGESGPTNAAFTLSDSGSIYYYFVANEYAIAVALSQSTSWFPLYMGETIRDFCTPAIAGRAFLASAAAQGSNTTFTVDRDLSNSMTTGSKGFIIALTPSGSVRKGIAWSISRITAITGTSITMANTAFTHSVGDLFGCFPQTNVVGFNASPSVGMTSAGTASVFTLANLERPPHLNAFEGTEDPNAYNRFAAVYWGAKDASTTNTDYRSWWGCFYHWIKATNDGTWTLNDRARLNFDNNKIYRAFPSLTNNNYVLLLPDTGSVV